jgi:hypothetical protein
MGIGVVAIWAGRSLGAFSALLLLKAGSAATAFAQIAMALARP